jgi:DNA processing protein
MIYREPPDFNTLRNVSLRYWLQLSFTDGVGPILTRRLIEAAGSIQSAITMSEHALAQIEGVGTRKAATIYRALHAAAATAEAELAKAASLNVSIICPDDEQYPLLLRSIPDPPLILYMRGELQPRDLNGFAIVGSRKCSYYGREQAERFGALLAGAGFTIVSGGARGTDSAAHRGALSHPHGRTMAVLGSGVDVPYPRENAALFDQIATRGAVISEYPLGTPPLADNFPRRNRIIAGLSRGVLVTESADRSGALITARQAGEDHGRPVFAMPGRIDNPMSAGPHQLIRDGAILAAGLDDILNGLGPLPASAQETSLFSELAEPAPLDSQPAAPSAIGLSDRQALILKHLDGDAAGVDVLIDRTGLDASAVLQDLTLLTLKGLVRRVDGQTFVKK